MPQSPDTPQAGGPSTDPLDGQSLDSRGGADDAPRSGSDDAGPPGDVDPRRPRLSTFDPCPYLAADGRAWRSAVPDRAHRCTAVAPPALLALDKQRRLCLLAAHLECATFRAAVEAHTGVVGRDGDVSGDRLPDMERVTRWAITRSTPTVLDHGRLPAALSMLSPFRRAGQAVLGGLMVVAVTAVLASRLGNPDEIPAGALVTPTPGETVSLTATPAPTASTASVTATPAHTTSPTPTPTVTAAPIPSATPVTYVVRSGDTLSAIASRFGTTVAAIVAANGITDPSRLSVGQVLTIPGPAPS